MTKITEIEEKLKETMKNKVIALKEKNNEQISLTDARITSLKLIKSELIRKNVIDYGAEYKMSEDEEIDTLNKMANDRKKNIEKYRKAGRNDLADADEKELAIVKEFLPQEPSEDELKDFISQTIDSYLTTKENDYKASMKDMGEIKKLVNETYPNINGAIIKDVLLSKIK